jgi:septum formation protein
VFTHALPSTTLEMALGTRQELLEKPISKADHVRMLQDLNGNVCEVVTGVSLGERWHTFTRETGANGVLFLVFPVLTAPGYATR